jgi:hypothetical protein
MVAVESESDEERGRSALGRKKRAKTSITKVVAHDRELPAPSPGSGGPEEEWNGFSSSVEQRPEKPMATSKKLKKRKKKARREKPTD